MRTAMVVLAVFALATLAGGGELDDLAARQKAAVYSPTDVGLKAYVVEFTASIWAQIPQLKDARLIYESRTGVFSTEGVAAEHADEALNAMKMPFDAARIVSRIPYHRVSELQDGFSVTVRKIEDGHEIVAVVKPGRAGPRTPARLVVVLDSRGLLVSHVKEWADGSRKILSAFRWEAVGDKWLPLGYTRTEEGRDTTISMVWAENKGLRLPVKVTAFQAENFEHVYAFHYRKVEGAARDEGPFGSPEAAIRSFIDACLRRDPGMIAKCFHEKSEAEFEDVRQGRITAGTLDELKAAFGASRIEGAETGADGRSAIVRVTMMRGEREVMEEIELAPDQHGEWKIVSF